MAFSFLNPKPISPYGDFTTRLIATTIDTLICFFLTMPFGKFIVHIAFGDMNIQAVWQEAGALPEQDRVNFLYETGYLSNLMISYALQMAIFAAYVLFFWHKISATPGKWLLGYRIVDAGAERLPSFTQYVLRLLGYIPSAVFAFMGFFWIIFDKRKQGWHDKIAGTVVMRHPKRKDPVEWIRDKLSAKQANKEQS